MGNEVFVRKRLVPPCPGKIGEWVSFSGCIISSGTSPSEEERREVLDLLP